MCFKGSCGWKVVQDIEGRESIAVKKMIPGRIAPIISSNTCCSSVMKDEVQQCTSTRRFSKSTSCSDLVASGAKSSCEVIFPNNEKEL